MHKLYKFIDLFKDPLYLAGLALGLCVLISTIGMSVGWTGLIDTYPLFPWMIAAAMLLYYSVFTGVSLMVVQNTAQTWGRAVYGFMGYVLLSGAYAWMLSGKSIFEASTYKGIYLILTLSFFVFLSIGTSVKGIVSFTERRDQQRAKKHRNNDSEEL
jgi:hypothetical protein